MITVDQFNVKDRRSLGLMDTALTMAHQHRDWAQGRCDILRDKRWEFLEKRGVDTTDERTKDGTDRQLHR